MNAHRIETTLEQNGELTLRDLPFAAGDAVEVIVLETARNGNKHNGGSYNGVTEVDSLDTLLDEIDALPPMDAPADFAAQHDHYLYGTPKRENP